MSTHIPNVEMHYSVKVNKISLEYVFVALIKQDMQVLTRASQKNYLGQACQNLSNIDLTLPAIGNDEAIYRYRLKIRQETIFSEPQVLSSQLLIFWW